MDTPDNFAEKAKIPLIRYPRFRELHDEIRLCQRMTAIAGEPQCMALEGVPGAGKTTLALDYTALFPRIETDEGTTIPVFYVETPSPVTVKGMACHLLRVLGDPAADKGTLPAMNARLIGLIKDCGVQLVILDDFHHLIDSETNHILSAVSDWLKVLIKETKAPFLVVGIEGKVELILEANAQLARLFAARQTLQPFAWEPAQTATIEEFATFIEYVEQAKLPLAQAMPRTELLYRIYYATGGVVANIMNLMNLAAVLAGERGQGEIGPDILSLAFKKRLARPMRGKVNPFELDWNERFTPPAPKPQAGGRKGQERLPSISATLTTK
ncbi:MAG: ATP-binding protein [Anaerolineae bacterium]|nr:ATP-binding protein [Anaerolineae bacterium]